MRPVEHIQGKVYPFWQTHIDTDQIIPAKWLQKVERTGYAEGLFELWRQNPDCPLNDPRRAGGKFILAAHDYGCGSSREIAVWAMRDFGIQAVIAPSIADIHRNNLPESAIVPAIVSDEDYHLLYKIAIEDPTCEFHLDLLQKTIHARESTILFTIEDSIRKKLLLGHDTIDATLLLEDQIAAYEAQRPEWMPCITE